MRTWLYNKIKALVFPSGMGDKITSSGSTDNPAPPFLVVQMGTEQPVLGMPASSRTMTVPFTVWAHDAPGSMLNIDAACVALKNGLPSADGAVIGGMSSFGITWDGTGEDAFDDHYSTNCRPVRFTMTARR